MDISAAVFTHGLIVVSRAGQGNTHNSATEGPGGAQNNNTTEELLKHKISNAYPRRFKGLDGCIRLVNHTRQRVTCFLDEKTLLIETCQSVTRFMGERSWPLESCRKMSSGLLNAILTDNCMVGLLKKSLADIKTRPSIAPAYFQHLIDSDDYVCLTGPVDVGCEQTVTRTIFGYKIEVAVSVVAGIVVGYQGSNAQAVVDAVHESSKSLSPFPKIQTMCLKSLYRICSLHNLPPRAMQMEVSANPADYPVCGGYADVFRCTGQDQDVAVKMLRTGPKSDLGKVARRYYKELIMWGSLRHPNVLPLLGVPKDRSRFKFAMVSEWMPNGRINEFLRAQRDVNRFKLLADSARGLIYLRGRKVVHGDLKGDNILIDKSGNACLADFGLHRIFSGSENSSSSGQGGTFRWMSPELFDPIFFGLKNHYPTESSDCYALAMVIYEVLSGRIPFSLSPNFAVPAKVLRGERPERPQGAWFTDDVWGVLEDCWKPDPSHRPSVDYVFQILETSRFCPPGVDDPPVADSPAWTLSDLSIEECMDSETITL